MSKADPEIVGTLMDAIAAVLKRQSRRPVVLGVCGAQGSGKTTLARAVLDRCHARGIRAAALSIDDLYRTRAERDVLARTVHPLLTTRGPPGTHDIALGLEVFDALERGEACRLPRFDKARDDRAPRENWPLAPAACQVLVFEGWCVGAKPQTDADLIAPVNELEAREDPDGVWRRAVNAALAGDYQRLFARIDCLALLAAPDFGVVHQWRLEQEEELRQNEGESAAIMDAAAIARFIGHYERITRAILAEMPGRASIVIELDRARRMVSVRTEKADGQAG